MTDLRGKPSLINRIICALTKHQYKFVRRSLEGTKVFRCRRCGKHWETF